MNLPETELPSASVAVISSPLPKGAVFRSIVVVIVAALLQTTSMQRVPRIPILSHILNTGALCTYGDFCGEEGERTPSEQDGHLEEVFGLESPL